MLFFSKLRRKRPKVRGLLKGLYHIIGHPFKKQKLVFASINLFLHPNSFLSSVIREDNFSKLAQLSQVLMRYLQNKWFVLPDDICLISFS